MNSTESDSAILLASRLRAAREAAKITQSQAAAEIGVSRPTLIAIEKGTRRVDAASLVKLANLYKQDLSSLLRPSHPPTSIRAKFRSALASSDKDEQLAGAVEDLEKLADDYLDLARRASSRLPGREPAVRAMDYLGPSQAGEDLAIEERNRLGLGDAPLGSLREILEIEVGLRIFFLDLPSRIAGLFIYVEPLGGCVGVNGNHPPERQRWTMAHEYAHFLVSRERSEVTSLASGRMADSERLAESFAENFLMPRNGILRRFHELSSESKSGATPATLVQLAHAYRVSVQALCLRLEGLGAIRAGTWDKLKDNKFQPRAAADALNLPTLADPSDRLPYHYRTIAAELYYDGEITETQYSRFLGLGIIEARSEFQRLMSTLDVAEDGEWQVIDLVDSAE